IYMAAVNPHLMPACDVSIDIDTTLLKQLERIQKLLIRRWLGPCVANRSPVALLFLETGIWPVRYRRITLTLCYGQYALSLPHNHFLSYAMADSFALARARKASWIANLARILQNLHRPVLIYLARQ
ncbi:hypothetical protein ARMSODRAFT_895575, partial [Armillaria solidipes]